MVPNCRALGSDFGGQVSSLTVVALLLLDKEAIQSGSDVHTADTCEEANRRLQGEEFCTGEHS